MRTGFLSELELISQQENQRLTFVKGLDDSFFDATRTREDMITMIERDSALQRMRIAEEEQEKVSGTFFRDGHLRKRTIG